MAEQNYLHGFDEVERQRLLRQAEVLAPIVYDGVDFSRCHSILELGSGVGAQTLQLLQRFPHLRVTCVELSEVQLESARHNLKNFIASGQVQLLQASAEELPLESNSFDGVFVCWLLEHVQNPLRVLQEANRVLHPKGQLFAREVFNKIFYLSPESRELNRLWDSFNQKQIQLGGDPFVGVKLGSLLQSAEFCEIQTSIVSQILDRRTPELLKSRLEYWQELFLSGFVGDEEKKTMIRQEFAKLQSASDAIFCFGFVAARAVSSPLSVSHKL